MRIFNTLSAVIAMGLAFAAPAFAPYPCTMLITPAGIPASIDSFASLSAVSGVSSDGLAMHVLPAAIAGAIFQESR